MSSTISESDESSDVDLTTESEYEDTSELLLQAISS